MNDPTQPNNPSDGLLSAADWRVVATTFELSERESTVARMLFEGLNRHRIAAVLRKRDGTKLSPETIRVYIDRLFGKLNVTSQGQMIQRIIRVVWRKFDRPNNGTNTSHDL